MKENSSSDLRQPEMSTEYIEYLFSGEKPKKPIPKKLWIIPCAVVLIVVLVCLLLNPVANQFSGHWQDLCAEAFAELTARESLHYTLLMTSQNEGKDPVVTQELEMWLEEGNQYRHYIKKPKSISEFGGLAPDNYQLWLDGELYSRNVATVPWQWQRSISGGSEEAPKAWSDYPYTFSRVHIGFSGIQVTYTKEPDAWAEDTRIWLVFHFDLLGDLTQISYNVDAPETVGEKRKVTTRCFTICDTTLEEIQEFFNRCRWEVEDIKP